MTGLQKNVQGAFRTQEEIDGESQLRIGRQISFTDGVPPIDGEYIFLMWDGMLVEGVLRHQEGKRVMTHYNMTIPFKPDPITHSVEGGKIVAYAEITGRGRV